MSENHVILTPVQTVTESVDCFVAYLDIIGFKEKVLQNTENAIMLANLIISLKKLQSVTSGGKWASTSDGGTRIIALRARAYSDNLIIFVRKQRDDLSHLLFVIRFLQDALWRLGMCLRGGVTLGTMYWSETDDDLTIGQGAIEAYELETRQAIFPRIVVSSKLNEYAESERVQAEPFARRGRGGLVSLFREDFDGVRFLDLLHPRIMRPIGEEFEQKGDGSFTIRYDPTHLTVRPWIFKAIQKLLNNDSTIATEESIKHKLAWLKKYQESSVTSKERKTNAWLQSVLGANSNKEQELP